MRLRGSGQCYSVLPELALESIGEPALITSSGKAIIRAEFKRGALKLMLKLRSLL